MKLHLVAVHLFLKSFYLETCTEFYSVPLFLHLKLWKWGAGHYSGSTSHIFTTWWSCMFLYL